ncbi:MAG: omega-amidase [Bacteroidia bacterium]|jgi:omega-amidase
MIDIRVTVCQVNIGWQAKKQNLARYSELISHLKGETDIIVFPETFTTGFSMKNPELSEEMAGLTVEWMKAQSVKLNADVVASFICKEDGKLYNRFVWARPNGSLDYYNKRHLFSFANEDALFTAGTERKIFDRDGWKMMPQVCYDLRFPVFSRNLKSDRYDVLFYIANWPKARASAWKSLLVARAHENQCYVVGVNRVGADGNGIEYQGDSMVISPKGEVLAHLEENEALETVALNWGELSSFRDKFRPLNDADNFELSL